MTEQEKDSSTLNDDYNSCNTENLTNSTPPDNTQLDKQKKKKRRTIIWVSCIALFIVLISLPNMLPVAPGTPLTKGPMYGNGFKALLLTFSTDDISDIAKNKEIAESFLPGLIREAEQMKVDSIVIQASHRDITFLLSSFNSLYGYVWKREIDGKWHYHKSSNNNSLESLGSQTVSDPNDKFIGKWKLCDATINGKESVALKDLYMIIDKSDDKYTVTELPQNKVYTATLTGSKLTYCDNGAVNTFRLTEEKDVMNLHIEKKKEICDVVCLRVKDVDFSW